MKENMRIVYKIEVSNEIESVEDINEAEFPVLELLKSEGVPYQIDILKKMNYERFTKKNKRRRIKALQRRRLCRCKL